MEDADLEEAATLAAAGSYKNSGQRCTAVKRMLVHESVAERFTELLVEKTRAVNYGDPMDPETDMGTVIDEAAARSFEERVNDASRAARGCSTATSARVRSTRRRCSIACNPEMPAGAARRPSVRSRRSSASRTIDEAIRISNSTAYGLSSAVCTNRLDYITRFVARPQRRHRQRARGAGLPDRADAVRRHQGFRASATRRACRRR